MRAKSVTKLWRIRDLAERLGDIYTPPVLAPIDPGPTAEMLVIQVDAVMACFHDGWHEEKVGMAWRLPAGAP